MNTSGAAYDSFNVAAERQIGRYGDKPFCTWYDDQRDERVELSYKTFGNWVAKTANLLVDELGAGPGDRVGVLATHWQTPIVLAACWRAGVGVVAAGPSDLDRSGLVAVFVHEEQLAAVTAVPAGTAIVALIADVLGRGGRDLGRALNFSRIVPSMGDVFDGGPGPTGAALTAGAESATMDQLFERAAALAGRVGLGDADRLLSGRPLLTADGAVAGLLAPFAYGAGVVLVRHVDPARFWKRVADERVTVAVLDPDQAAAVGDAGSDTGGRLRVLLDD